MADTPQHVAIIMDGNGRWARSRGLPRAAGHRASVKVVRRVVEECARRKRPLPDAVRVQQRELAPAAGRGRHADELVPRRPGARGGRSAPQPGAPALHRRPAVAGRRARAAHDGCRVAHRGQYRASGCRSRWPTAAAGTSRRPAARWRPMSPRAPCRPPRSARRTSPRGSRSRGIPDPDLLIRTGGEQRISNFLLWNLAYTELYFTRRAVAGVHGGASRCGIRVLRPARAPLRQDLGADRR